MNILGVTSEMVPYAKTGGLADVLGALPRYLQRAGHDVRVFVPLYDTVKTDGLNLSSVCEPFEVEAGPHRYVVQVFRDAANPTAYLVRCPALYHRGMIYSRDRDEHRRFLVLSLAALLCCQRMGFAPDVLHCNDWQSAMLPLLLKARFAWDRLFARTRTLLSIHNLNYQGGFGSEVVQDLSLGGSEHLLHQDFLRQGRVNFLLHGILFADGVSTVSPTYAKEIQTPEHGAGLDPFLRARTSTVVGILNGVDYEEWSPERDRHIPHPFSATNLGGKEQNKQSLLAQMGLPYVPGVPLIGIVSRMAGQKGFNLIPHALTPLLKTGGVQMVVLGNGGAKLEQMFAGLQHMFPKQVCFYQGFSNPLAHLIEAGSDMFLMPSKYEPCGLNQMYSLRYGTVPIVHRTGGLADTVAHFSPRQPMGTGFVFDHHDSAGLRWATSSALEAYANQAAWRRVMANGMAQDYSWERQTRVYEELYARLRS